MCTLYTHAAVGLGLGKLAMPGRMPACFWLLAGFLPLAPDFDGFSHAAYGSIWGHRGFTHGFCFALALSLVAAALAFRHLRVRFWLLWTFLFAATASHGVLDALTTGGEGIPFFWPLSERRYGPYGPIHWPEIGAEFPNPWVSAGVRAELLWVWLPLAALVAGVTAYRWYRRAPA
jgi:inner membrane protein